MQVKVDEVDDQYDVYGFGQCVDEMVYGFVYDMWLVSEFCYFDVDGQIV